MEKKNLFLNITYNTTLDREHCVFTSQHLFQLHKWDRSPHMATLFLHHGQTQTRAVSSQFLCWSSWRANEAAFYMNF